MPSAPLRPGLGTALLCMHKSRYTRSFVVILAMLPAVVQLVIMLVNGNVGGGDRELRITIPGNLHIVCGRAASREAL